MSDGFAYLDIIFFAMVAAFIALRLRSVLGRRTGNERQRGDGFRPTPQPQPDNVVPIPERALPPADDAGIADGRDAGLKAGLTAIRLADRSFDLDGFLQGSAEYAQQRLADLGRPLPTRPGAAGSEDPS